jgi:hypothetical protein
LALADARHIARQVNSHVVLLIFVCTWGSTRCHSWRASDDRRSHSASAARHRSRPRAASTCTQGDMHREDVAGAPCRLVAKVEGPLTARTSFFQGAQHGTDGQVLSTEWQHASTARLLFVVCAAAMQHIAVGYAHGRSLVAYQVQPMIKNTAASAHWLQRRMLVPAGAIRDC